MTGRVQVYVWMGLDTERYRVYQVLPQDEENAIMILQSKGSEKRPWCVKYQRGTWTFATYSEAMHYCQKRRWAN